MIVAGHLAAVAATILLVALWIVAGGRLLSGLHREHHAWPRPLALVTSALLGQGLCALLMMTLGSVELLRPPVVLGVLIVVLALLRRDVAALGSRLRKLAIPGGTLPRVALGAWVALGVVMVVLALAPPWDWDTLMYHQSVPLDFLRASTIRVPPDNLHVSFIGIAQLASLPLLAAGLESGPAMASVASYLLLAGASVGIAQVVAEEEDGWWSMLFLLGTPGFLLVATTARIDVTVAGALLVAHALMLLAMVQRNRSILVVAAVCFGVAGGMKLHGLAYAAACAPLALFWWRDRRALGIAFAAFAVTLAPWLLKNFLLLGAPFHPLGSSPTLEPWLAAIVGSATIPASFDIRVFGQLGESRAAFNLWDAFFAPHQLTIEPEGAFYGLPLLLLLVPVALFGVRRRPVLLAIVLPAMAYLFLILVPFPRTNLRYLFPALPPLILVTVAGVRAAFRRPVAPLLRSGLIAVILGVGVISLSPAVRQRIGPDGLAMRWALGLASRNEARTGTPDVAAQGMVALEDALSGLGDDALVLLLWEARTGGIEPRALADVRLSNWSLLSQTTSPSTCLATTGITHVVINRGSLSYYLARGASPEVFRLAQLQEFVQRCLTDPEQVAFYQIFRVHGAASEPGGLPPTP